MSRDALVVGISKYQCEQLNTLGDVPVNDAEAIAQILEKYGRFRVRRLPEIRDVFDDYKRRMPCDEEVTTKELKDAIKQLFYPQGDHVPDMALFYFSGHGLRELWLESHKGYLATSNANPEQEQWGFELKWLQDILGRSPIKKQIVWLDCCHSGDFLNLAGISDSSTINKSDTINENLQDITPTPDKGEDYARCLIVSSRGFEASYSQVNGRYSVLTDALLKGLDPTEQEDGIVTNLQLSQSIEQLLSKEVQCPLFLNSGPPIILTGTFTRSSQDKTEEEVCPYKGLEYFDLRDAEFFCGRTDLTSKLITKISKQNFLAVIGPSGSGKSSVIRAGLLYQLKLGQRLSGSYNWDYGYKPFTPGEEPLQKLEQVIGTTANKLTQKILANEHERVVLFIDQFEECFTLCKIDEKRQQFFNCLLDILEQTTGKLCLIIAMRADFLSKCAEYPRLACKIRAQESLELVTPMNKEELKQAIEEPARKVNLEVKPLLINRIVEDVENYPGSLPLLEFTLKELWEKREEYLNSLTLSAYNDLGGIKGALETVANKVYQSLLPDNHKIVAKRIFLELVQLGEGTEDTRRRVLKQSLINEQLSEAVLDEVVSKLQDARLITASPVNYVDSQSPVILEVVHEALIRHWKQLREWIARHREEMRIERTIEAEAEEWQKRGKLEEPAQLRQGTRLKEAENHLKEYSELGLLNRLAQEYIQVSRKVQNREDTKKDRQIKKLQKMLIEANLREQASKINTSLENRPIEALLLAIKATKQSQEKLNIVLDDPVLDSLQWAIHESHERNQSKHESKVKVVACCPQGQIIVSGTEEGKIYLWDSKGNPIGQSFQAHKETISAIAFSPDGQCFVSGSEDQTLALWNLQGQRITTLSQGLKDEVTAVVFSPDGQKILSGSYDGTIYLWDLAGNPIGHPFGANSNSIPSPITSVAFSQDREGKEFIISSDRNSELHLWNLQGEVIGKMFEKDSNNDLNSLENWISCITVHPNGTQAITLSLDGKLRLWNLHKKQLEKHLPSYPREASSVIFTPDGQRIILSSDSTIYVCNEEGEIIFRLKGHESKVNSMTFVAKSHQIASVSDDKTLRLWCLETGHCYQKKFNNHTNRVNSVTFSSKENLILSGSSDKTVKLWNLQGELIRSFKGHKNIVNSVTFSPDEKLIVSGSDDSTVGLWDLQGKLIRFFEGHEGGVNAVAFSPNGNLIVSTSDDRTVGLWDLQGKLIRFFEGHEGGVNAVAFSPNGNLIVSGSDDSTVGLWDLQGKLICLFKGHEGAVNAVAFSPNGNLIVSTSDDRTVGLWNLKGKLIRLFKGHRGAVNTVAFSCNGNLIVSGSADKTLRFWNLNGIAIGPPLFGHQDEITSVAFSSDQCWVISGSYDKTLLLWQEHQWDFCLKVACDVLRSHSIFREAKSTDAKAAYQICKQYFLDKD